MSGEEFEDTHPYVVAHVNQADGAWGLQAFTTMREALRAPRWPGCATPIVFGSWTDYEIWKIKRTPLPTPGA